jgi:hypothetical protein
MLVRLVEGNLLLFLLSTLCLRSELTTQTLPWRLSDRPQLELGGADADPNTQFARVQGAFRLSDGRLAIVEFNTPPTIRYFGSDGSYLGQFGRAGGGPGEFRAIAAVYRTAADTLVAYDPWQGRLTYITPAGKVGRMVRADGASSSSSLVYVGRFDDGTLVARRNRLGAADADTGREATATGPRRDSIPLFRVREDGAILDTILRVPGELYDRPTPGAMRVLRYSPYPGFLVAGSRIYVSHGDEYRITVHDREGRTLQVLQKSAARVPVTQEHLKALERATAEALAPLRDRRAADRELARHRELPSSRYLPVVDRFLVRDSGGNLWTQDFGPPGAPRVRWSVFGTDGKFRGSLDFPARFRLHEVGQDYVLGSWTDEEGAIRIQLYSLTRNAR